MYVLNWGERDMSIDFDNMNVEYIGSMYKIMLVGGKFRCVNEDDDDVGNYIDYKLICNSEKVWEEFVNKGYYEKCFGK